MVSPVLFAQTITARAATALAQAAQQLASKDNTGPVVASKDNTGPVVASKDDAGPVVASKKDAHKDPRLQKSRLGCAADACKHDLATIAERADSPFVSSADDYDEDSESEMADADAGEQEEEEVEDNSSQLDDDNDEPPAMHAGAFFAVAHTLGHVPREYAAVRARKVQ